MKMILILCYSVLTFSPVTDTLTLLEAERGLMENCVQLHLSAADTAAASARLQSAEWWDNPEVAVMYNLYNPVSHRLLDAGPEGETDISVSQPIAIGGQRRHAVASARASLRAAQAEWEWVQFESRMELRRTMGAAYAMQRRVAALDGEIESAGRIVEAYRTHPELVSRIEQQRIEALRIDLLRQRAEWEDSLGICLGRLALMTGIDGITAVASLVVGNGISIDEPLPARSARLESLLAAVEAESAEVKRQRALALPQMAITAEYDKNGNIGHNFWAAGITLSIPLWNRGQGAVREAQAQYAKSEWEYQAARQEREEALRVASQRIARQRALAVEAERITVWDIQAAERQYLQRNISLMELIDLYSAHRAMHELLIDIALGMVNAAVDYNLAAGYERIVIQ